MLKENIRNYVTNNEITNRKIINRKITNRKITNRKITNRKITNKLRHYTQKFRIKPFTNRRRLDFQLNNFIAFNKFTLHKYSKWLE